MTLVIVAVLCVLICGAVGALILWLVLPELLKRHIDYRQRWEDAVTLLGNQGQLTDEQVALIRGGTQPVVQPEPAAPRQCATCAAETSRPHTSNPVVSKATLRTLHSMATWDRKDAEIARARNGKPPLDDLVGMATWDIKDVLNARAKYGTG